MGTLLSPTSPASASGSSISALELMRLKQAVTRTRPLLRLDAGSLVNWGKDCMDSDDLAGMWAAITKCKDSLSHGRRLENLAWRLWQRESNLSLGRGPPWPPHAPVFSAASSEDLSDPEAGNMSSSDDDDGRSLSSVDDARSRSLLSVKNSSRDTSPQSEGGELEERAPVVTPKSKRSFLPLLPPSPISTLSPPPPTRPIQQTTFALFPDSIVKPSHHRAESACSLPPMPTALLPPPRPNALTPGGLANIIATLLPMDVATEARELCMAMAPVKDGGSRLSPPREQGEREKAPEQQPERWSAPEPSVLSQLVASGLSSAEVTPVGTPSPAKHFGASVVQGRLQVGPPPRIVNIAPTPPASSPAVSRASTPPSMATKVLACSPLKEEITRSQAQAGERKSLFPRPSSPFSPEGFPKEAETERVVMLPVPVTLLTTEVSSSGSSSTTGALQSVVAKRNITDRRSVRISPPYHAKGGAAAMERHRSSGRTVVFKRGGGGSSAIAMHARTGSSSSISAKVKGKAKTEEKAGVSSRGSTGSIWSGGPLSPVDLVGPASRSGARLSQASTAVDSVSPPPLANIPMNTKNQSLSLHTTVGLVASPEASNASSLQAQPVSVPSSPPVPATPMNSQASVPLIDTHSLVASYGVPANFPDAPPPTPARQGVPLPTTMTAKSVAGATAVGATDSMDTPMAAAGKRRAKFFIDSTHDSDDEGSLSPHSNGSRKGARFVGPSRSHVCTAGKGKRGGMDAESPVVRAPPPPMFDSSVKAPTALTSVPDAGVSMAGADDEFETESDSDEWGSEFTDEEAEEEAKEAERAAAQAEFQKALFAKRPFVGRDSSMPDTQVKRAGLSMLFHPELRDTPPPNRNQSAVELRRPLTAPAAKAGVGGNCKPRSLSNLPRPSSLLKAKSSVALPVLAQGEPEMEEVSASVMSQRSLSQKSVSGSGTGTGTRVETGGGSRKAKSSASGSSGLPPPPATRPSAPRHPSRLGAQPEDAEFSDDSGDEDDSAPSAEQSERLAAVAARKDMAATRPQPIAQPLSPRTTRRNMLADEMTESVRRNLIWERQTRAQALGVGHGRTTAQRAVAAAPVDDDDESPYFSRGYHHAGW